MCIPLQLAIRLTLLPGFVLGNQIAFDPAGSQLKTPVSNTPPDQLCFLSGRVTDNQTGQPLRKVNVRLLQRNGGTRAGSVGAPTGPTGYASTSDAEGNFHFENVEPGDYTLTGERVGYLHTQYGSKRFAGSGAVISLRPSQQLTGLALAMFPQSVITGRIVDDDGDPINGVTVQIVSRRRVRGKLRLVPQNSTYSNDLGEFRIANLAPGKYFLDAQVMRGQGDARTSGRVEMRPVRTFYPEAINLESATPVELKVGQDVPGINIRMHSAQTYHIRGRIAGISPDDRTERMTVNVSPRGEESSISFGPQTSSITKDHTFDLTGVSPGSYYLNIYAMDGRVRSLAHQEIEVGAGDVNEVVLSIVPGGTIHGHVSVSGAPAAGTAAVNLSSVRVSFLSSDNFLSAPSSQVQEDGSFSAENLIPGKYVLSIVVPGGAYTKSLRLGQQEIQRREIDLSNGVSGQIEIMLTYGTSELTGTVQRTNGSSESGSNGEANPAGPSVQIVLIPETLNADGSGSYFGSLTKMGTFSLKQIAPGRYHAYAFDEANVEDLQNPDVLKALESRGTEVEIGQAEQKQIQLSLISADEYQRLLVRLGLEPQ